MATIPAKSRAEGTVDRVGKERSWCSSSTNAPHQFALLVKTLVSAAQTPRALRVYGVKDSQMEAVSFGEEKPKATGHDEAAHAQNRRADLAYPEK